MKPQPNIPSKAHFETINQFLPPHFKYKVFVNYFLFRLLIPKILSNSDLSSIEHQHKTPRPTKNHHNFDFQTVLLLLLNLQVNQW